MLVDKQNDRIANLENVLDPLTKKWEDPSKLAFVLSFPFKLFVLSHLGSTWSTFLLLPTSYFFKGTDTNVV